jgi:plastocyanin
MRRTLWVAGLATALAIAACGGGGGGGGSSTTCSPNGAKLSVVAQGFSFDQSCYAVPAGQPFTVTFDNKDSAPHNFAIYTDSTASKPLSDPATIIGTSETYQVKALPSGTYYFQCDTHTSMNGTFIVK